MIFFCPIQYIYIYIVQYYIIKMSKCNNKTTSFFFNTKIICSTILLFFFSSCLHFPNLYLVVELQVHRNANTTTQSSTEYFQTQAWTKIKITDTHLQPVIGRFFVPFKILPIIAKMSDTKFDAVPQVIFKNDVFLNTLCSMNKKQTADIIFFY